MADILERGGIVVGCALEDFPGLFLQVDIAADFESCHQAGCLFAQGVHLLPAIRAGEQFPIPTQVNGREAIDGAVDGELQPETFLYIIAGMNR